MSFPRREIGVTGQLNGVPVNGRHVRTAYSRAAQDSNSPGVPASYAYARTDGKTRPAGPRHYLMCPPTYFDVKYSINPWMDAARPVDRGLAYTQWAWLRDLYRDLGHHVSEIAPVEGLPDMIFTASAATVVDGRVLLANFRYRERAAEIRAYRDWFGTHGFGEVHAATHVNEGEADCLLAGDRLLCGTGFRTSRRAHGEVEHVLGCPVISLTLIDPRFFHLDTALCVLSVDQITYYPQAFAPDSQDVLRSLYPDAILADETDAQVFGLNAASDGRHVVVSQEATHMIGRLRDHDFIPLGVDVSELTKAGGGVKCCTLELRAGSH